VLSKNTCIVSDNKLKDPFLQTLFYDQQNLNKFAPAVTRQQQISVKPIKRTSKLFVDKSIISSYFVLYVSLLFNLALV